MKASHYRVLDHLARGASVWYPAMARLAYIFIHPGPTKFVRVQTLQDMADLALIDSYLGKPDENPDVHWILTKDGADAIGLNEESEYYPKES